MVLPVGGVPDESSVPPLLLGCLPPEQQWPQAPLLLRPTPGSQTVVRGIRFAGSTAYEQEFIDDSSCGGPRRAVLPINTGHEKPGKALVIDFETPLFVGSFLIRIQGVIPFFEPASKNGRVVVAATEEQPSSSSYFDHRKRTFHVVVRGQFRQPLRMSECVTGQAFDHPLGKLPAALVVQTAIRVVSSLAPQLELQLRPTPRFVAPLVATAHTVLVHDHNDDNAKTWSMDDWDLEEPAPHSVLDDAALRAAHSHHRPSLRRFGGNGADTVANRQAFRKRVFNRLASQQAAEPRFDVGREYTFVFYQHLLVLTNPHDLQLHVAATNFRIGLSQALDGQPIKVLAAHRDATSGNLTPLWSFDLWHQSMLLPQSDQPVRDS